MSTDHNSKLNKLTENSFLFFEKNVCACVCACVFKQMAVHKNKHWMQLADTNLKQKGL